MKTNKNIPGKDKRGNNVSKAKWSNLSRIIEIGYKCISTLSILIQIINSL